LHAYDYFPNLAKITDWSRYSISFLIISIKYCVQGRLVHWRSAQR